MKELEKYLTTLTNEELNMIQEELKWAAIDGGTNEKMVCNIMSRFFEPYTTLDKLEPFIENEINNRR